MEETLTAILGIGIGLVITIKFWHSFITNKKFRCFVWTIAGILVVLYKAFR